jgi:HSP20 family protein
MLPMMKRTRRHYTPSTFDEFFGRDLFNDFFYGSPVRVNSQPSVNVKENEKAYEVELVAPGLKKEDFKIEVADDVLTVSSEVEVKNEKKDDYYSYSEYKRGNFEKRFRLPDHIETESIKAVYEDGILKINLPKNEVKLQKKVMKIDIA